MKKNLFYFSSLIIACLVFGLTSCQKDTTDTKTTTTIGDRAKINRTVNYTVLVVAGEATSTSSEKSAKGATGASVSVSVAGAVVTKTTDASGQATFPGLTAGRAAVSVKLADHTTANYTVDLFHTDTIDYDNQSLREAATKVILLPITGAGMVTISGKVFIQSDITTKRDSWSTSDIPIHYNTAFENASGTGIAATVSGSSLSMLVTNLMGGAVSDITLENCSFTSTVGTDGLYSISVPSTANGVSLSLTALSTVVDVLYSFYLTSSVDGSTLIDGALNTQFSNTTQRVVFSAVSADITAVTGKNQIVDLTYSESAITITDPHYFGSSDYSAKK